MSINLLVNKKCIFLPEYMSDVMTNWQSDEEGRVAIEKTSLSPLTTESKNQVRLLGCEHRVQVDKKSSFFYYE